MQVATLFREGGTLVGTCATTIAETQQYTTDIAAITSNTEVSTIFTKNMGGDNVGAIKNSPPPESMEVTEIDTIISSKRNPNNIPVSDKKNINTLDERKRKCAAGDNDDCVNKSRTTRQKQGCSNFNSDSKKMKDDCEKYGQNSNSEEFGNNLYGSKLKSEENVEKINQLDNVDCNYVGTKVSNESTDTSDLTNQKLFVVSAASDKLLNKQETVSEKNNLSKINQHRNSSENGVSSNLSQKNPITQCTYKSDIEVSTTTISRHYENIKECVSNNFSNKCNDDNILKDQSTIPLTPPILMEPLISNDIVINTNDKTAVKSTTSFNYNKCANSMTSKYPNSYDINSLVGINENQDDNKNIGINCEISKNKRTEYFIYNDSDGCARNNDDDMNNTFKNLNSILHRETTNKEDINEADTKHNHMPSEGLPISGRNTTLDVEKPNSVNTFYSDRSKFKSTRESIESREWIPENVDLSKRLENEVTHSIESNEVIDQKKYYDNEKEANNHLANPICMPSYHLQENIQTLKTTDIAPETVLSPISKNENVNFKPNELSTTNNLSHETLYTHIGLEQYQQHQQQHIFQQQQSDSVLQPHQPDLQNFEQGDLYHRHRHQNQNTQMLLRSQQLSLGHQIQTQISRLHTQQHSHQSQQRDNMELINNHTNLMPYLQNSSINIQPQEQHQLQESFQQEHQHPHLYHPQLDQSNLLIAAQQQQQNHEHNVSTPKHKSSLTTTMDDLILDEFQDERNPPYKLGLSPSIAKQENQDDGYETSAGDVLTPNSSSTHSVTPQHQIQQCSIGLIPPTKCEERKQHINLLINDGKHQNISIRKTHNQEIPANTTPNDPFTFMSDELAAGNQVRIMTPQSPPHSNYMSMSDRQDENLYALQTQHHQQQQMLNTVTSLHVEQHQCADMRNEKILEYHQHQQHHHHFIGDNLEKPPQKRRGRKKKILNIDGLPMNSIPNIYNTANPNMLHSTEERDNITGALLKTKERKKHDRFNGMSEEEVIKRTLPDHLCDNLDIVIIGINPGLFAAYKGHHYAGPGNHFWKCLYMSGLTQEQMSADEDYKLMDCGIGFTNMVQRATKGSADLTRKEIKEGSRILLEKLQRFQPKIAVFNGKLIFEVFSGKKDFNFGRQPECVDGTNTYIWVMPSSSARCAQLPRAADKVPFYSALKKFRDYLNGLIPHIDESECIFTEQSIKQCCEQENSIKNISNCSNVQVNTLFRNNSSNSNQSSLPNETVNPNQNSGVYANTQTTFMYNTGRNTHGIGTGCHEAGPGPPHVNVSITGTVPSHNTESFSHVMSTFQGQPIPEKKKRGRPKKIKGQELIDPTTGNKIQVHNMQGVGDCSNILNLSVVGNSTGDMPKKKRGRPKKLKLTPNQITGESQNQKSNSSVLQSGDQRQLQQQSQTMYMANASPTNYSQRIYPSPSPIHSPAIHTTANYGAGTPPMNIQTNQQTPPLTQRLNNRNENSKDIISDAHISDTNNKFYTNQLTLATHKIATTGEVPVSSTVLTGTSVGGETHLVVSPTSPNSPNICAVDFDPPTTANTSIVNNQQNIELQQEANMLNIQQRSRFENSVPELSAENQTNNNFQWLQSQQHINQRRHQEQHESQQSQLTSNYREQELYNMQYQQEMQNQSEERAHIATWQQRQCFDNSNNYLYSTQNIQLNQNEQQHRHPQDIGNCVSENHKQISSADVASKSLSGLESLVDQIPTITESDNSTASALTVTSNSLENNLQVLQSQHSQNAQHNSISVDYTTNAVSRGGISDSTSDTISGNSGDNVTGHTISSVYGNNSPGNFNINHINSTASAESSPVLLSPHQQQQQQSNQTNSYELSSTTPNSTVIPAPHVNSPKRERATEESVNCTPPTTITPVPAVSNSINNNTSTNQYTNATSSIHNSSFSVSNLAASSVRPNVHTENYSLTTTNNTNTNSYHHHSSFHTPMYLDHHTHAHQRYESTNSHYLFTTQNIHHPHHHPHHHPAYGSAYDNTYRSTTSQALHVPSPNYPYSYGAPPAGTTNYATTLHAHHQSTPTPPPPSTPGAVSALTAAAIAYPHHAHLSMYERLKPSDLGGYGGF